MARSFFLSPVMSDGERAFMLLQMARVAYTKWAELSGIEPDWDGLSAEEMERWAQVVRVTVRAMFSLMGDIVKDKAESRPAG